MELLHDYDYISDVQRKLESAGYGEKTVYSLNFCRYFSEEEKAANKEKADSVTDEEWSALCDDFSMRLNNSIREIVTTLDSRYNIHQTKPENSTTEHYRSDWDLFFWSNEGWNGKGYMDCFSLTFNERRTPAQNMALLAEIIAILENMEYKNIACRIQYDIALHHEAISEAAYKVFDGLVGKPFEYMGMTGKIKLVSECNGTRKYGFFKKGAKKRYYHITDTEILTMNT